jgi:hypothetical protein
MRLLRLCFFFLTMFAAIAAGRGEAAASSQAPAPAPSNSGLGENTRLILKDGSYQLVRRYEIRGDRVRYISAERGGEWEEVPNALIDWAATRKWAKSHGDAAPPAAAADEAATIDREAAEERALAEARTPTVAPGLTLPEIDGVLVLDTFAGQPQLVELRQTSGDVNANPGHNVLRGLVGPLAARRQTVRLEGYHARVAVHVNDPVFYVSADNGEDAAEGSGMVVDTAGKGSAGPRGKQSAPAASYAIVRLEESRGMRLFSISDLKQLGNPSGAERVAATHAELMAGRDWLKVTPARPLDIGEYALVELLGPEEINLAVWDFRVDPSSPANADARTPILPAR